MNRPARLTVTPTTEHRACATSHPAHPSRLATHYVEEHHADGGFRGRYLCAECIAALPREDKP